MKKKIVFIHPYPLLEAASQRFRFAQYLGFLEEKGFVYSSHAFLSNQAWRKLYNPGNFGFKIFQVFKGFLKRFSLLPQILKADFVFIHRECAPIGPPVFEWIIAKVIRKKIIYDFDDAIWIPNFSHSNRNFSFLKWYGNTKSIIKWSHKVSCGNHYLCDFAAKYNANVVYNPTTIDTENHHSKINNHTSDRIVIGWTGSHSTLPYLFNVIPVIRELEAEFDFEFRVIADHNPRFDLRSFSFVTWNKETEIDDLAEINIGLMPLEDDKWAKGKCGFKALQYMALGIPSLVSPVGVNESIVKEGVNGFICRSQEDWLLKLRMLLQKKELIQDMGKNTRETVVERYSVLSNKDNFLSLFQD